MTPSQIDTFIDSSVELFFASVENHDMAAPVIFYGSRGRSAVMVVVGKHPEAAIDELLASGEVFDFMVFCAENWVTRLDDDGNEIGLDEAAMVVRVTPDGSWTITRRFCRRSPGDVVWYEDLVPEDVNLHGYQEIAAKMSMMVR